MCLLDKDIPDAIKQKIAAEMNLSETAFVLPSRYDWNNDRLNEADMNIKGNITTSDMFRTMSRFSLRWFTPTSEVPLCGHATLASAAVLFFVKKNQQVKRNLA